MDRWNQVEKKHKKGAKDEEDLKRIRDKAIKDLERAKEETDRMRRREEDNNRKLRDQLAELQ